MLEKLKESVYKANMLLPEHKLITFTWGNVSGIDRNHGIFAIKPSGIPYDQLTPDDIVLVDLQGKKVEGKLHPSSDTPTHLALYNSFKNIGGIVHTHSRWATIFAQAGHSIPAYGTTQADYFYGEIPCTRDMKLQEIQNDYEYNTGKVIIERFKDLSPENIPAVLVKNHGPFTWGTDAYNAVHNAVVLEEVAMMALYTQQLTGNKQSMSQELLDKHFLRKHGPNAYYGQKGC
ncbi:L-ribulose-5-phosphate 4-epimerase [Pectinatus brassicae]|uniref:L-ribulose-5-phosphate 4-epimerase n=1 Tax=Pectinatus brassicae TaxID=862415 RepID=A0A840UQY7_9FIRM|nr:L-ribulose-5-phosphate 4-epimerase [Pectinatus brassicae]MBB5334975.1 L-ribulose-5-phosphate 4-epimerase [Pectinatus brassicae]